ncbi:MAG TPA: hypothetical protein VJH55_01095 [Candidatus Paceibacterota bacterium]
MNTFLLWIGSGIAILLYFPLIRGILCGKIEQNFATWILWVALDGIALGSILLQGGNYLLLVFYCIGGSLVCASLLYTKQFKWTGFETFVLLLVFICLAVWAVSGPRWGTVASTLAVIISGAPQIKDSWRQPDRQTGYIYLGYILANAFSFWGGKAWTIEDRFYPGMCAILCAAIACASLRKAPALIPKVEEKVAVTNSC